MDYPFTQHNAYRNEVKKIADDLEFTMNTRGWAHFRKEMEDRIKDLWGQFIALPADQKTTARAHELQGRHEGMKEMMEWVEETIQTARKTGLRRQPDRALQGNAGSMR